MVLGQGGDRTLQLVQVRRAPLTCHARRMHGLRLPASLLRLAASHNCPSPPHAARTCTQVPRLLVLHADRPADACLRERRRRHGGVRGGCAAPVAIERRPWLSHRREPRPMQSRVR